MSTWIIGGLVIGLLVWITVRMIKNRNKGGCACGGCDGCPEAKNCHRENEDR